jgi:hypothetical protein
VTRYSILVVLSAAVLSGSLASSRLASAQSICDGVLRDGVLQRSEWRESYYSQLVLAAHLSRMTYQEARQAMSVGGSIAFAGISLGADFSEDESLRVAFPAACGVTDGG